MKISYAVTFEFDQKPPETVRGFLDVANPRLAARRAVEAAQKARPKTIWQSMLILLERGETEVGYTPPEREA